MKENTFFETEKPSPLSLDEVARLGAQEMLRIYLEAEIQEFISRHQSLRLPNGQQAIVRNGYHDERPLTVGSGTITVKVPRSRDKSKEGIAFSSAIVPKYMRRSLSIDEAIPLLYLLGISTNDMMSGLEKLLGPAVSGLSAANISRIKASWKQEYDTWKKQDLSSKEYCYLWADGIHFNLRFEDSRLCTLVIIGALEDGTKELVAVESGYRESSESWSYLLRDIKERGLPPAKLLIGDGALGLWNAAKNVYPQTRWQRCWVHKTANILDALPKGVQPKAKSMIHEMYMAETKKDAESVYTQFIKQYQSKYPKAVECLTKSYDSLFTFYDFPAEHWKHIRTTNVIESSFATVRNRTDRTRGHGTMETTLLMVYKLLDRASQRWIRLRGHALIGKVLAGIKFENGIELKKAA